jgi:hypothetical protein
MDILILAAVIGFAVYWLKSREQRHRIALLGSHLGNYQIEKLMENLTQGYLRALGESDAERSGQIWRMLRTTETQLSEQFNRFAAEFAQVPAEEARVSRLPVAVPQAVALFPSATFDLRKAFAIHAKGIASAAVDDPALSDKDRAFTMSAELFLMQHTCHWFCKSKAVASARMLARHQTAYHQLLASVAPATRRAYLALVEG